MANNVQCSWKEYEELPELDKWKAFPTAPVREFLGRWVRLYERLIYMVAPTIDPGHGDRGEYFTRADNVADEDKLLVGDPDDGGAGIEDDNEELAVSHENQS